MITNAPVLGEFSRYAVKNTDALIQKLEEAENPKVISEIKS